VTIEKPGVPAPNGLGAYERSSRSDQHLEEVVRWEEPTAMDYHLFKGRRCATTWANSSQPTADGGTMVSYGSASVCRVGGGDVSAADRKAAPRVIATAYSRLADEIR